jgi:hypothetical protein
MKLKKLIQFEPIDLTKIILYLIIIGVVLTFFNKQLTSFLGDLNERKIIVETPSGSSVTLDVPVKYTAVTAGINTPEYTGTLEQEEMWEELLSDANNYTGLAKGGFRELFIGLESLEEDEIGVINFVVDDNRYAYFGDRNMLKYLSIASEKIQYLAFYRENQFQGCIKIQRVVKGLASEDELFQNFGEKLREGAWSEFPGLITLDQSFTEVPTIKELYLILATTDHTFLPLVENGKMSAILNYETVADGLYEQTQQVVNQTESPLNTEI